MLRRRGYLVNYNDAVVVGGSVLAIPLPAKGNDRANCVGLADLCQPCRKGCGVLEATLPENRYQPAARRKKRQCFVNMLGTHHRTLLTGHRRVGEWRIHHDNGGLRNLPVDDLWRHNRVQVLGVVGKSEVGYSGIDQHGSAPFAQFVGDNYCASRFWERCQSAKPSRRFENNITSLDVCNPRHEIGQRRRRRELLHLFALDTTH